MSETPKTTFHVWLTYPDEVPEQGRADLQSKAATLIPEAIDGKDHTIQLLRTDIMVAVETNDPVGIQIALEDYLRMDLPLDQPYHVEIDVTIVHPDDLLDQAIAEQDEVSRIFDEAVAPLGDDPKPEQIFDSFVDRLRKEGWR